MQSHCLLPVGSAVCVGIVVLTTGVSRGGWKIPSTGLIVLCGEQIQHLNQQRKASDICNHRYLNHCLLTDLKCRFKAIQPLQIKAQSCQVSFGLGLETVRVSVISMFTIIYNHVDLHVIHSVSCNIQDHSVCSHLWLPSLYVGYRSTKWYTYTTRTAKSNRHHPHHDQINFPFSPFPGKSGTTRFH